MIGAMFKMIGIIILCLLFPLLVVTVGTVLGVALPIIGGLLLLFLPLVLIGVAFGYFYGKNRR